MNRVIIFILIGLFAWTASFAQKETVFLNYPSDLPFKTVNDSDYYHLESTLMIRKILSDIVGVLEKKKNKNQEVEFTILIKNDHGAVLPINYLVEGNPYNSEVSKNRFMKRSYDWINRSFRSNIPYED